MRLLLFVLFILITPVTSFADLDSIVVNVYDLSADFDADGFLYFLRFQAQWQDGKDSIVLVGQGTSTSIQRSADGGVTWGTQASDIGTFGPSPWSGNDHAHTFILGDTLYAMFRLAGYDSVLFGRMDLNGALTVISRDTVGAGVACNYANNVVMSPVKIGEKIIGGWRGGDCNFRYIVSDDFFATQTSGWIEDYTAILGDADTRGGMLIGNNGEAIWTGWLDYGSVDSIVIYAYDTATDSWSKYPGGLANGNLERFYAAMPFDDSAIMLVSADINTKDTLFYSWLNENDSTWTSGTVFERTISGGVYETLPMLVKDDSTGRLGLFYIYAQNLYYRYWKDDYTWSNEYTIIGGDTTLATVSSVAVPYITPTVNGSVVGVVVKTTTDAYFVRLQTYETAGGQPEEPSTTQIYIRKGYFKSGPLGGN